MNAQNWQWILEHVAVPLATLIIGLFAGMKIEKTKNKAIVKNSEGATVIQGRTVGMQAPKNEKLKG